MATKKTTTSKPADDKAPQSLEKSDLATPEDANIATPPGPTSEDKTFTALATEPVERNESDVLHTLTGRGDTTAPPPPEVAQPTTESGAPITNPGRVIIGEIHHRGYDIDQRPNGAAIVSKNGGFVFALPEGSKITGKEAVDNRIESPVDSVDPEDANMGAAG